jgi:H/ACA ribonucleoprotein complex subunit 2
VTKKQTAEVDVKPDVKKAKKKKEREPRELRHYPLSPISVPLANDEDQVALFKLLEAGSKAKNVRRGVKEVQKAIRKKETGVMIFAGDVEPLDVISHLPVLCEDNSIPFIFVRSKEELGAASSTKRPTSCILVREHADYKKLYEDCKKRIKPVIY